MALPISTFSTNHIHAKQIEEFVCFVCLEKSFHLWQTSEVIEASETIRVAPPSPKVQLNGSLERCLVGLNRLANVGNASA